MKKIVIIVLVAIVTIFVGWEIVSSWIPKFSTYQQQIKYADEQYRRAGEIEEIAFYMPSIAVGEFIKHTFYKNAWKRSVRAYNVLLKLYPKEASQDIDVWLALADSHLSLKNYDKALELYQKELELFRQKYFKNPHYSEKKGVGPKDA